MKKIVFVLSFLVLFVGTGFAQYPKIGPAEPNEELVTFVKELSKSWTLFAKNLDKETVLKYYDKDVTLTEADCADVPGGTYESEYYNTLSSTLDEMSESFALNQAGFLYKVVKVNDAKVFGDIGYISCRREYTISDPTGSIIMEEEATLVVSKKSGTWKVIHCQNFSYSPDRG